MNNPEPIALDQKEEPQFPHFELSGGPHGHKIVPLLNGKPMKGVHRIEITADVNDVIRVKTYTFASVDVELDALVDPTGYLVRVREPLIEGTPDEGLVIREYIDHGTGRGGTLIEALEDIVATMRATKAEEDAL